MAIHRGIDGHEPVGPEPAGRQAGPYERRRATATSRLAIGTLACPACDAPVSTGEGPMSPADPLSCGFCDHAAALRDFLSLTAPTRPARVEVRVVRRPHQRARRRTSPAWGDKSTRSPHTS